MKLHAMHFCSRLCNGEIPLQTQTIILEQEVTSNHLIGLTSCHLDTKTLH